MLLYKNVELQEPIEFKSSLIEWLRCDLWSSVHIVLSGMKSLFAIMQDASKVDSYRKVS